MLNKVQSQAVHEVMAVLMTEHQEDLGLGIELLGRIPRLVPW